MVKPKLGIRLGCNRQDNYLSIGHTLVGRTT